MKITKNIKKYQAPPSNFNIKERKIPAKKKQIKNEIHEKSSQKII
jgi:hypothetical protein